MTKQKIISLLKELTNHDYIEITLRGNAAITAALSVVKNTVPENRKLLIPEEGGWLHYKTAPKGLGLEIEEVKCNDAKIDLRDLKKKLSSQNFAVLLYHNPGGYFDEQPIEEIYQVCNENNCLVILDVSGGIGTKLCNGKFADIMVGSFGKWKLVEARVGGFISCKKNPLWNELTKNIEILEDEASLLKILQKLEELPERIRFLENIRDKVINDLSNYNFNIVHPNDLGFVLVIKFSTEKEKDKIVGYCKTNKLEWTECPRYIRLNQKAISVEIKRL